MDILVYKENEKYTFNSLWAFNFARNCSKISQSANFGNIITQGNVNGTIGFNELMVYNNEYDRYKEEIVDCVNYGVYLTSTKTVENGEGLNILPFNYKRDYYGSATNSGKLPTGSNDDANIVLRSICPREANATKYGNYASDGTELKLADIKAQADDIIQKNNDANGKRVWGKVPGGYSNKYVTISGYDVEGCPMPIECGGKAAVLMGEGTEEKPYLISSEADLRGLVDNNQDSEITGYYKLTADIDMTGKEAMGSIGNETHPFSGVFDGNGHVISGLTESGNALFGCLGGTVKNLAIVNMNFTGNQTNCAAIAYNMSGNGENAKPTISNCYVGGSLNMTTGATGVKEISIAGICNNVSGSGTMTIEDCYFKGVLNINKTNDETTTTNLSYGGLVANTSSLANGKLNLSDSYASFTAKATGKLIQQTVTGLPTEDGLDISTNNCYFVCDNPDSDDITITGSDYKLESDKKLLEEFEGNDNWYTGTDAAYRPVLKSARNYQLTDYNGNTVYVDAIPMGDGSNNIYNFDLSTEANQKYSADPLLWALPNVAVYNQAEDADYILNCNLNPESDFHYTKKGKIAKGAMHYPLTVSANGYSMLCLPCTIRQEDLPEGSKLMMCGEKVTEGKNENTVNVVECDTIPAGVPFIAYVPGTAGDKVDVVLRGEIVEKPTSKFSANGKEFTTVMKGSFISISRPYGKYFNIKNSNGKLVSKREVGGETKPFAGLILATINQYDLVFTNYILLDETADNISEMIDTYNGKKVNVKMKRALKTDNWNTICLPFDMTADEIKNVFGNGTKIEKLNEVKNVDGVCNLVFGSETEIKAGVAYMIMPGTAADANGIYTFGEKLINGAEPQKESEVVNFDNETFYIGLYGNYDRLLLCGDVDGRGNVNGNVFFVQKNTIYKVGDESQIVMNGFRGYIQASSDKATQALASARMIHSDGTATALKLVEVGTTADGRLYNIQGMEVSAPTQSGIYIKNGRKFIKK